MLQCILKILNKTNIKINKAYELRERNYAGLTGLNKDDVINDKTLQKVNMPNKAGFIDSWGPDWWREWIHQKYAILFTSLLLLGVLIIILFARKITQYRKQITYTKIFLTGIIFLWLGVFQGL